MVITRSSARAVQPFRFADLPPELQLEVFTWCLARVHPGSYWECRQRYRTRVGLLLLNRATYELLGPIFYQGAHFLIYIGYRQRLERLLSNASSLFLRNVRSVSCCILVPYVCGSPSMGYLASSNQEGRRTIRDSLAFRSSHYAFIGRTSSEELMKRAKRLVDAINSTPEFKNLQSFTVSAYLDCDWSDNTAYDIEGLPFQPQQWRTLSSDAREKWTGLVDARERHVFTWMAKSLSSGPLAGSSVGQTFGLCERRVERNGWCRQLEKVTMNFKRGPTNLE